MIFKVVMGKVVGKMVGKLVGKMLGKVVVVVGVHVVLRHDSDKSCLLAEPIPPFEVRIWSG